MKTLMPPEIKLASKQRPWDLDAGVSDASRSRALQTRVCTKEYNHRCSAKLNCWGSEIITARVVEKALYLAEVKCR